MQIISNGGKFGGQEPDTIEKLLEVLASHPLDPRFDYPRYGQFFYRVQDGDFNAFGNFADISHVFNIRGTFEELRPIAHAIKRNRRSIAYLRLKHGR